MGDLGTIEVQSLEPRNGFGKRSGSLLGKEETILAILDKVTATTVLIGDDRATSGESFNGSNTKRFKAGKEIGFGVLKIDSELITLSPREKLDERAIGSELNETGTFGAVADNE